MKTDSHIDGGIPRENHRMALLRARAGRRGIRPTRSLVQWGAGTGTSEKDNFCFTPSLHFTVLGMFFFFFFFFF